MTTQKHLKRRVRERMSKTGEHYSTARQQVLAKRDKHKEPALNWDLAAANEIVSDRRLTEQTGQGWIYWISALERWGGREHAHPEIVEHLGTVHGVAPWWRQAITNGFERATGIRIRHQQRTGFTVYASKTVSVPVADAFDAFVSSERRAAWLSDGTASIRSSQGNKTARFDWNGGPSRLLVTFESKGTAKSTVHVAHERVPTAQEGEQEKGAWKARLSALQSYLQASSGGSDR
jgi:hypothetical protein